MSSCRITPAAQLDLSTIWEFTEEHWGARQAEIYILEIRAAIERVADEPERGFRCDEIRSGYRRYIVGSHMVFYVERREGVDVIRILHQRMDVGRHI